MERKLEKIHKERNFSSFSLIVLLCSFSLLLGKAGAQNWITESPSFPLSLGEVTSVILGNTLYVVGQGASNTCKLTLSPRSSSWDCYSAATRPNVGNHHSAVTPGDGTFWLVGGLNGGSEGKIQIYKPSTNSWSTMTMSGSNGGSVNTVFANNNLYVCGGFNLGGGTTIKSCTQYNTLSKVWTTINDMPVGVNHAAFATDGFNMFVMGGRSGGNVPSIGFDTVQIYNFNSKSWQSSSQSGSSIKPLPQARGGMGTGLYINGEVYVIGGETPLSSANPPTNGVYVRMDIYNPVTNSWRRGTDLPFGMHGFYPVYDSASGNLYVVAGGVRVGSSTSSTFIAINIPKPTTTTTTTTSSVNQVTDSPSTPSGPTDSPATDSPSMSRRSLNVVTAASSSSASHTSMRTPLLVVGACIAVVASVSLAILALHRRRD
eukprot:m.182472 g.182472  ORF g.182472 m.182472 type:complete len:430 (-) comp15381_c0_seq1:342-1631(-)